MFLILHEGAIKPHGGNTHFWPFQMTMLERSLSEDNSAVSAHKF